MVRACRTAPTLMVLATAIMIAGGAGPAAGEASKRPNILVIVADDVGFSELGAYGGEARTPNLDALAGRGAKFTAYRTSPLCSPSRAMLLTGLHNHRTGVATIPEVLPPEQRGKPGYVLHLEPGVETLADRLRRAGWRTALSGKWHLGDGPANLPNAHGFERSFALEASGADNWDHRPYMPFYTDAPWREDGRPARYPSGQYSSTVLVDRLIAQLSADPDQAKPFFAWLSFLAVHIPVQAPPEVTQRYLDTYAEGWDSARARRFARLRALGLVPEGAAAPPTHPSLRRWNSLSPEERQLQTKAMAAQAAMLEVMDREIGRLVDHLRARGQLDNTIIVFTSDNGPEPSDPVSQTGFPLWMRTHGYTHELANLGERGSFNFIGPEWASVNALPGALFKFYTTEGGIRVPLIVAGPGVKPGQRIDAAAQVTDVAPTLLDMAGNPPAAPGARSIDGVSQAALLAGRADPASPQRPTGIEVSGNVAWIEGPLKLVHNAGQYGDGQWRLFDIIADPGETRDLAGERPQDFARMKAAWDAHAARVGVLSMPPGYDVQRQIAINARLRQLQARWPALAGLAFGVLALGAAGVWLLRRRAAMRRLAAGGAA